MTRMASQIITFLLEVFSNFLRASNFLTEFVVNEMKLFEFCNLCYMRMKLASPKNLLYVDIFMS